MLGDDDEGYGDAARIVERMFHPWRFL
jgi:hypothetical protein